MKRLVAFMLPALLATGAGCPREREREAPPPAQGSDGPAPAREAGATAAPPHEDEAEAHEELPTKVRLPPEVVRAAGIVTAPAGLATLPATVDLPGELAADPDRSARLTARVPGRVVDVKAKEGDRVKAGQTIAVLESPELARASAALDAANARARVARLNAERLRSLEAKSLASGQEVAAAAAESAALDAEVAAARLTLTAFGLGPDGPNGSARGETARVLIRTPIAGFVLSRDAVAGQTVQPEHVLAVVGDLDRVYFLGRLFEKDLARVKVGATAEVRLNAYPNEVFEGKVETIGRQIDPAARTVTARVVVANQGDLVKVGLFGTARVVTGDGEPRTKHVVVPLRAVTRVAERDAVFVRQPDEDFELHPVTLGRSAGGRVEILGGLRAGEQVVVEGAFTLKSAILKSSFGQED
jgi:cobalt-zinc-cadmium efflux system membrane fusion protein